jgi:hypothetical protein
MCRPRDSAKSIAQGKTMRRAASEGDDKERDDKSGGQGRGRRRSSRTAFRADDNTAAVPEVPGGSTEESGRAEETPRPAEAGKPVATPADS